MEMRRLITVTGVNRDGTPYSGTMYESLHGTSKETPLGIKWGTCSICLLDAPVNEMVYKNGKYYCRKYKCYEDLLPKEIQS